VWSPAGCIYTNVELPLLVFTPHLCPITKRWQDQTMSCVERWLSETRADFAC
jgi:hypothetical protein